MISNDLAERILAAAGDLDLEIDRWTIGSPELEAHAGFGPSTVDYSVMTNVVGTCTTRPRTTGGH